MSFGQPLHLFFPGGPDATCKVVMGRAEALGARPLSRVVWTIATNCRTRVLLLAKGLIYVFVIINLFLLFFSIYTSNKRFFCQMLANLKNLLYLCTRKGLGQ